MRAIQSLLLELKIVSISLLSIKFYFLQVKSALVCDSLWKMGKLYSVLMVIIFSEDVRELGFTVLIDMRGNSSWSTVKPILKVLQDYFSSAIHTAHIIKPDNFWQKQRTNLGSQKYKFEVGVLICCRYEVISILQFNINVSYEVQSCILRPFIIIIG